MGYVVTLIGFRPAPRTDQIWTTADVQESAVSGGPWTTIDVNDPLTPLDTDPLDPQVRSFTTTNATAPDNMWYRVIFKDAAGNTQTSTPSYNAPVTLAIPSVEDIRAESDVAFEEYNYPAPVGAEQDRLEAKRRDAAAYLQITTGIDPASIADDSEWARPTRLAIRLLTEYAVTSNTQEIAETAGDFDMLSNFSVGGYSESRRDRFASNLTEQHLHPDPRINRLLILIKFKGIEGDTDNGPEIAFADQSQMPPGYTEGMDPQFYRGGQYYGPGVSPPGPYQPSLADLLREIPPL